MEQDKSLDKLIKDSVEYKMDNIEVPKMDDVWSNIEQNINKKRKVAFFEIIKNKRKMITTVASVLIITIILFNTSISDSRVVRTLMSKIKTEDGIISMDFNTNDFDDNVNGNESNGFFEEPIEHSLTLNELKSIENFDVKIPQSIPAGYSYKDSTLLEQNGNTLIVIINYISQDNKTITLTQQPIKGELSHSVNLSQNNAKVKKVNNNNVDYYVINYENSSIEIVWDYREMRYILNSNGENENELMRMALSIN